jgi:transglutaminase-like putative cysteine protease
VSRSRPSAAPPSAAGGARRGVPDAAADAAFVVVLGGLGMVGFRSVYGDTTCVLIGLLGVALGCAVAALARRWRQPVVAEAFVTLVAFLLLGGAVAAPHSALGGIVPTARTFADLGRVGISGWQELLTTAPPVGNSSDLLAIPYVIGLVGGAAGQSIAQRTKVPALPLVGPLLVLSLSILFGAHRPESLVLQGSVFAAVALAWTAVRHHRTRHSALRGAAARRRVAGAVALLTVAGLAAGFVGPNLPGGSGRHRVVLSRYVVPPFEANRQASPLAAIRRYEEGGPLNTTALFTVHGVPSGTLVRIATMDRYDGIVWGFGSGTSSNGFRRFGSTVDPGPGTRRVVTVRVQALGGIWLPDVGRTAAVIFTGLDAAGLTAGFRYDASTGTAAEPLGLAPGVTYRLLADVPPTPSSGQLSGASAGNVSIPLSGVPPILRSDASQWSASASTPWGKVQAIADHLRTTGYFSTGTAPRAGSTAPILSRPGHGEGRLTAFLEGGGLVGHEIVGDDEQYAAAFALMANAVGVPARVVLGADVPPGGTVTGADVHAWIEVSLAGLGWVSVPWQAFVPTRPAQAVPPNTTPQAPTSVQVTPPVVETPSSPLQDQLAGSATNATSTFGHPAGFHLPGWLVTVAWWLLTPLLLLAALVGSVSALKRRRRTRRRRSPTTSGQIAGGWAELLDVARDCGHVVPGDRTRREQAAVLGEAAGAQLARRADAAVFAANDPTVAEVEAFWASVDELGASLQARLSRWRRWQAAANVRSLRPLAGGAR